MPRSSRHKSKQKDAREYSDVEEEVAVVKGKQGKEESGSRYREAGSGEKRKVAVKDVVSGGGGGGHGNEYSSDEYVGSSKRRKEKERVVGSDRWNGSSEGAVVGVESEVREEKSGSEVKGKSGGSGRYEAEKKESLYVGKEESRIGKEKEESKRRSERDRHEKERVDREVSRKEGYKEKDRGYERDDIFVDSKRDSDYQGVDNEESKVKKGANSKGNFVPD